MKTKFDLQIFAEGEGGGMPPEAPQTLMGGDTEPAPAAPSQHPEGQPPAAPPQDFAQFTIPEGMEYGQAQAQEFSGLAKELGLNQEQAQKLVDFHAKHYAGAQDDFEKQLQAQVDDWGNQTKNHPEFGGQKLPENLGHAQRFIAKFGGDELKQALNESGMGNHPALFVAFAKAGKLLAEDSLAGGGHGSGAPKSFEDVARNMYPNMTGGNN